MPGKGKGESGLSISTELREGGMRADSVATEFCTTSSTMSESCITTTSSTMSESCMSTIDFDNMRVDWLDESFFPHSYWEEALRQVRKRC